MTAATRKTPDSTNGGSDVGIPYTAAVDTEIEALWICAPQFLTSIGGTANAISATSDIALVVPLTGIARPMCFWIVPISDNTSTVIINIDSIGNVPVVDKDGVSLAAGALKAGRLHLLVFDGTSFRIFSSAPPSNPPTPAPDMIIQEQQATNTAGGTFTSGSFITRALNTVVRNVISGASLSASLITLPSGTYAVNWSAPGNQCAAHATRFFNVTDSAIVGTPGTSETSPTATLIHSRSSGNAVFTITSAKVFRLDHQCKTTQAANGLGVPTNISVNELYSFVNIWKTA